METMGFPWVFYRSKLPVPICQTAGVQCCPCPWNAHESCSSCRRQLRRSIARCKRRLGKHWRAGRFQVSQILGVYLCIFHTSHKSLLASNLAEIRGSFSTQPPPTQEIHCKELQRWGNMCKRWDMETLRVVVEVSLSFLMSFGNGP